MLRRLASGFSTSRSFVKSSAKRATAQSPILLSSRCSSSSSAQPDPSKGPGNLLPKVAIGTVVAGAAAVAAYQTGYLSYPQFKNEGQPIHQNADKEEDSQYQEIRKEEAGHESPALEVENNISENHETVGKKAIERNESKELSHVEDSFTPFEEDVPLQDRDSVSETTLDVLHHSEEGSASETSSMDSVDEAADEFHDSPVFSDATMNAETEEEALPNDLPTHVQVSSEVAEQDRIEQLGDVAPPSEIEAPEAEEERNDVPVHVETADVPVSSHENKEVEREESGEPNASQDHRIIIDLIDAIHAAEKRQAESDHRLFTMEKLKMKEKYEKELRDARARELMYAEEAAILDKELIRERVKAEAAAKSLQEKAEENLRAELQQKEEEMEFSLKKIEEMGKAELNAAIAKEKASHMEKMSEANLNIRALCMAFYARSEEARQNYSIHKLALGALALENALSKGLPIKAEINALQSSLAGLDKDSLLDLVLASLPEETLMNGTDTLLQLNQRFDSLKGTLRHFSLIPLGGGGMLAHAVAHVASAIKMRERNISGEGIESVICKVERLLAEGNLAEAADALERGVSGTEAEGAIGEWVKLARHRAITEQALSLLQAYAASISLT